MLKKYCVIIEEAVSDEFEVEAESEIDAVKKGIAAYKAGEFILEPGEIECRKIAAMEENENMDFSDAEWIKF